MNKKINIKWGEGRSDEFYYSASCAMFSISASRDLLDLNRFKWAANWRTGGDERKGYASTLPEAIQAAKSAAVEMLMQEIEVVPQPLTVIVPPIEWGEWKDSPDCIRSEAYSKCGRYRMFNTFERYHPQNAGELGGWYSLGLFDDNRLAAIAACQTHVESKVNRALQGCKIEPFRSPQGLVDGIKTELRALGTDVRAGSADPKDRIHAHIERVGGMVKEWEDGK